MLGFMGRFFLTMAFVDVISATVRSRSKVSAGPPGKKESVTDTYLGTTVWDDYPWAGATRRSEGQGRGGGSRRADVKFWLPCLERVGSLEKGMAHMKTWNAEKERHQLKDVRYGSLAYVAKEDPLSGEGWSWEVCAP